jgi:hypothetical protein
MSTLILRNDKGTPLTYQEADNNLTNILVAIGGTNTAPYTLPTPSGTGNPVLTSGPTVDSPRITTSLFVGPSEASNLTRFPNSLSIVTNRTETPQKNESHNIGLVAEGTANAGNTAIYGIGVYGKGYTNSNTRSSGVVGEGHVTLTGDTGSAIGVRGYANDTHAGGMNIGLYGDATGGASNYALYMNAGNITNVTTQSWVLGGNLTFSGAFTVTIPTLSLTNDLTVANGGTGLGAAVQGGLLYGNSTTTTAYTNAGNSGEILKSNGTSAPSWLGTTGSSNVVLSTSPIITTPILAAGTTVNAPLQFTGTGNILTTPVAGALEFDGTNLSFINDATVGRGIVPNVQQFRYSSVGAALTGATQNFFGANSAVTLAAATTYEVEYFCYFLKNTLGTVQWIPTVSSAFSVAHAHIEYTPIAGFTTTVSTAAMVLTQATVNTNTVLTAIASGSLVDLTYHIHKIRMRIQTNLACNLRLNVTISVGTITPQIGSFYTVKKVMSNYGTFVA